MHTRTIFLLLLALAGCGRPVGQRVESDAWSTHRPSDFGCCSVRAALEALDEHRKHARPVWAPPRLLRGSEPGEGWLPLPVLLRVEVTVYPRMSCKGLADAEKRARPARFDDRLARMDASELERLGAPESVTEIWMVPYEMDGVFKGSIGPGWLGYIMRHAGNGGAVYFPPYQDCTQMRETFGVKLPRQVFLDIGSIEVVHPSAKGRPYAGNLLISARSPFVARVAEVCEGAIATQRVEHIVSYHIPAMIPYAQFVGPKQERWRYTDRIEAQCGAVKRSFEYGPRREGFKDIEDPRLALRVSP